MKRAAILAVLLLLPALLAAQTPGAAVPPAAPDPLLGQIEQAAQTARQSLAQVRIAKWKADSASKAQFEQQSQALQHNLEAALPELVAQARAHPQELAAGFKLYRNLNALCEVLSPLTDAASQSAPQSDFQALVDGASALDRARRALADRLESQAAARDAELAKLRSQVQAAAPAASPKKTVIDDTAPSKKAKTRKKPTATSSSPQ